MNDTAIKDTLERLLMLRVYGQTEWLRDTAKNAIEIIKELQDERYKQD